MKISILIFALTLSLNSFADCEQAYQIIKVKTKERGKLLSTIGGSSPFAGASTFMFAIRFDVTVPALTSGTGLGVIAAAPAMTLVGGISYIQASRYFWVKKIINQSKVGMGVDLEGWAEDLSEKFNRDITALEVANVVNAANNKKVFCQEGQKLFSKLDFKDYVAEGLN